jgi:hypothetical protein
LQGQPYGEDLAGRVWDSSTDRDVVFEIPAGLRQPLPLAPGQLTVTGPTYLRTAALPAPFFSRSPTGPSGELTATATVASGPPPTLAAAPVGPSTGEGPTFSDTLTFVMEGAGDLFGFSPIAKTFHLAEAEGRLFFSSPGSLVSRLAELSLFLDCPALGISQTIVADWEGDYVELFYGAPMTVKASE